MTIPFEETLLGQTLKWYKECMNRNDITPEIKKQLEDWRQDELRKLREARKIV